MLGWEFFVHTEFSESTNHNDWQWPKDESVLATWKTGYGGQRWLDKLAEDGKVKFLGGHGYPIRYLASGKVILPLIKSGPPAHDGPMVVGENYATPPGYSYDFSISQDKIEQIDPDSMLVIDAWDLD